MMFRTEYIVFNKNSKCSVKGVLLYRDRADYLKGKDRKVLAIFTVHKSLSKRPQRRNIWKSFIWGNTLKDLNVQLVLEEEFKPEEGVIEKIVSDNISVFGFEIRALRRILRPGNKLIFDRFYYK